jgi:hypothetical protein
LDTLDSVLEGPCPSLLKIDVEGYEPEVLAGAERTLANPALQAVIMEMNQPDCAGPLIARGFAQASYNPMTRALLRARQVGNGLFVRPREAVAARLRGAPQFSVRGWRI